MTHRLKRAPSLALVALLAALAVLLSGLGIAPKAFAGTSTPVATTVAASPTPDASATSPQGNPQLWPYNAQSRSVQGQASKPMALAVAAVTSASCVYPPPTKVNWGGDWIQYCRLPSGAYWHRTEVGQDTCFSYTPHKKKNATTGVSTWRWVCSPTLGRLTGLVNYTTSAGSRGTHYMSVGYQKKVTDIPGVDPNTPFTVITATIPKAAKFNWSDTIVSPWNWSSSYKAVTLWTKPGGRVFKTKVLSPNITGSNGPLIGAVKVGSQYCMVQVHFTWDSTKYPTGKAFAWVRGTDGKRHSYQLTAHPSSAGGYFDRIIPTPCHAGTAAGEKAERAEVWATFVGIT